MEILGLTLDARGNWSRHIQAIASDARKRLGAIRRMSHMLNDKSIMRAYKSFVRSKIEYGSLASWGAAESHLKKLDRIQESAVALLRNPDPSLLPPSLENRREQAAIGFTCKLLDGREGVVWLATCHQSLMTPLPQNLGDQLDWLLQHAHSTFIN